MGIVFAILILCLIAFALVVHHAYDLDLGFIVVDTSVDPYYIVRDGFDDFDAADNWLTGVEETDSTLVWIDNRLVDASKLRIMRWDAPRNAEFYQR